MQLLMEQTSDSLRVRFLGELVARYVWTIMEDLRHKNVEAREVILDLSGVERADSAGVQVLIYLLSHLRAHGRSVAIVDPSPAVSGLIGTYNLTGYLLAAGA